MSNLVISGGVTLSGGFSASTGGGGGGGGPTLSVTSGLVGWFKADSLSLSDGDSVATWVDEQGNGNFVQAVAGSKPVYVASAIGGKPAIRNTIGNGSEPQFMSRSVATPTNFSMFIVGKATSGQTGDYNTLFEIGSSDYTPTPRMVGEFNSSTGVMREYRIAQSAGGYSALGTPGNNPFVMGIVLKNGISTVGYLNGVQTHSDSGDFGNGDNSTTLLFRYGGRTAYNMKGDIAEIIIYDRALTTQEISDVHSYLGAKYGITV